MIENEFRKFSHEYTSSPPFVPYTRLPPQRVEKAERKVGKNRKNSGKLFQIILQRAFYYIINVKKQNPKIDFVGLMN